MLFVTLVIWGVYCDNTIAITNYCVNNTKNDTKLKFVVITDLHNKEYGEKNADLAELVKEQNPDFIAVCGDMVNRGDPDTTKMKDVLKKLADIAPTYCCLGNHERDNAAKFGTDFKSETNSTGAVLLDNEYIKFTKNGKSVLIGGVIAPNQGLFPKYDKGEFDLDGTNDGTKMIVCAGLSNTVFIPRINNQVEIGVVTVV